MDKQKTILIALNHGIAVMDVLHTDIFRELQKSGVKIVLLAPNGDDETFQSCFGSENVYFERLEFEKYKNYLNRSRLQKTLKVIRWFTLNGRYDISSISNWYENVYKKERRSDTFLHRWRNLIEDTLIYLLRSSRILRRLLVRLESWLFTPSFHNEIFLRYKPDCVLVTSLGFFDFDQYIMREAKRHKSKVISMVLSWDNTSTRGMGGSIPDRVIAWTDIMKKELIELHDIEPEKIFVGGVAKFDHYYQKDISYTREDFLKRFNLSPKRKLIFFATKSPTLYPWNLKIVETISNAIEDDRFAYPCQLLVRLHPIHFRGKGGKLRFNRLFDMYDEISRKNRHIVFNIPRMHSERIAFDMSRDELLDLTSILHNADVMVNVFSTMNIEASIFDLPILNVCFDGGDGCDEENLSVVGIKTLVSVKIDEMQSHNQRIIETGGIRLAYNEEELIGFINRYLEDPGLDREGRMRIVEQECGSHRGEAGRRIAENILEMMGTEE